MPRSSPNIRRSAIIDTDDEKTVMIKDIRKFQGGRRSSPLKTILLIAIPIALVVAVTIFFFFPPSQESAEVSGPVDNSDVPIPLPWTEYAVGYNPVDNTHPDKVIFTFRYDGGKATLLYDVRDIDREGEVKIFLNGYEIADAPLSSAFWSGTQYLPLPIRYLTKNEENQIIFDNMFNPPPPGEPIQQWAVRKVRVKEDILPPPDPIEAEKYYRLGEAKYDERKIHRGNLFEAIRYYEKALDHLEGAIVKPPLYNEIHKKLERSRTELQEVIAQYRFRYIRAERSGDYRNAIRALQLILAEVPDRKDPRNIDAQRKIKYLRRKLSEGY